MGANVTKCQKHQPGVEQADPCEIAERSEVRYPFVRIVQYADGNIADGDAMPGGLDDDFDFELEFVREKTEVADFVEWIKPETRLSVRQGNTGFEPEPKIGKPVTETALSRDAGLRHVAVTDDER